MRVPQLLPSALLIAGLFAQAPAPLADLRERIELFRADRNDLDRRYDVPMSALRRERLRTFLRAQLAALDGLDFTTLGRDASIDWQLLHGHCRHDLDVLEREERQDGEVAPLLPFAPAITALGEQQRALQDQDPKAAATTLAQISQQVTAVEGELAAGKHDGIALPVARRALERLHALRRQLDAWFQFHDGYDPQFSWWARAPHHAAVEGLERWHKAVQQKLVDGRTGDASLVGDPIGEAALLHELEFERIPYTPAELVQIAEREFAFCDAEMQQAAQALGCGDDWKQALELVKQRYVEPGRQPALVRDLAREAVAFVEQRQLITIPELCKECWRMSMMSPAAQRVNPFFLGGETIQVSYPTEAMSQAEKLQSLRSNNEHFARATVFHELIPGHWLQQYSQARWHGYRSMFETPFWIEGWALYWEMRLYALGFARGPEDKVGMLYWRKHRCARIVFSLNFHLGRWTAPQCVDYLVERVGHERAAAEGEVRRSVGGSYGPLYQCAYMLGGLQLRALHDELVGPGKRSEQQFHDAVLQQNAIPIALIRAALGAELPGQDAGSGWRFADAGK